MRTLTSMIPGAFAPVQDTPIAGRNFIGLMYSAACSSARTHDPHMGGSGGNHELSQSNLRSTGNQIITMPEARALLAQKRAFATRAPDFG